MRTANADAQMTQWRAQGVRVEECGRTGDHANLWQLEALAGIPETEAAFQKRVIDFAQSNGWRVAHFRRARTKNGWCTPVAADGKGFPDLILVRAGVVLVAELKTDVGRTTKEQDAWLAGFRLAGIAASVWRPRDMALISAALRA